MARVFVAMSGGVDSAAAALLALDAGHQTAGIHARMVYPEAWGLSGLEEKLRRDAADAEAAARRLGIPFYAVDCSATFRDTVIRMFIQEYQAGRTPNPCTVCNRTVKFGALLDQARALGAELLATGHYARVERDESSGRWLLKRGADRRKDQSYFLYQLTQDQLARVLFPLGGMDKEQVRHLAEERGLVSARRRESQDICFIPGGDYAAFIENAVGAPAPAGDFLDQAGRVLGRHKGLIRYTHGQHKGLGLSTPEPLYVLEKDAAANTVRLGPDSALWSSTLTAEELNWIAVPELTAPMAVSVKTRYSQREAEAVVEPLEESRCRVTFTQPQRAVTPGQAVVFYQGDTVIGGGTIQG